MLFYLMERQKVQSPRLLMCHPSGIGSYLSDMASLGEMGGGCSRESREKG